MSVSRPAQIFATITSSPTKTQPKCQVPLEETFVPKSSRIGPATGNEIQVTATSELSLAPDRCRMTVFVSSRKENVQDAKNSVARRIDYIIQTLYNHQVKEGDLSTSKVLQKIDGFYHLDAEVTATLADFQKCQSVSNFLVEKLDENVKVSSPEFFHSPQRLENLRRQASLTAVSNARQKATEIARFLHANIGRPIAIREESVNEWEGSNDATYDPDTPLTMQQKVAQATVYVSVKCSGTFELKAKGKSKEAKKDY